MPRLDRRKALIIEMVRPLANFSFAMDDVKRLLSLHDSETKRRRGRPSRQSAVFKRAAVILQITAWESFIEDAIRGSAMVALEYAASPADVQTWFNSAAHGWLGASPKAPTLVQWAGDGWKALLKQKLEADLQNLNTPGSVNVRALSRRYLATDLPSQWIWSRTTPSVVAKRLDELIRLRGRLVHRGPEFFKADALLRQHAVDGMLLLEKLVDCTRRLLLRD